MPDDRSILDEISLARYRRMDDVVVKCHSCHESVTVEYDQFRCHLCKGELYKPNPDEGFPGRFPGKRYAKGG